jgi:hypothetical protein
MFAKILQCIIYAVMLHIIGYCYLSHMIITRGRDIGEQRSGTSGEMREKERHGRWRNRGERYGRGERGKKEGEEGTEGITEARGAPGETEGKKRRGETRASKTEERCKRIYRMGEWESR